MAILGIQPHLNTEYSWYNPKRYDTGASELVAKVINAPLDRQSQGSQLSLGSQDYQRNIVQPVQQSQNLYNSGTRSKVLGTTTNIPSANPGQQTGGGFSAPSQQPQNPQPQQPNGPQGPSEMDVINQEYDSFQSYLNDQEGMANKNFERTQQGIVGDRDQSLTSTENERVLRDTDLTNKSIQGKQSEALNLTKVRQLLADLDQRNNARMAISGGGSVADALSDKFSRTAQQSAGGVLQEGQRFQNDVQTEKMKAEQFYGEKKAQIQAAAQRAINDARGKLDENLAAINGERRASAAEKSRAKLGAWQNYLGQVNQARTQAASFQAQYDMWRQQMTAQLQEAAGYTPQVQGQDFSQYYFNPQSPAVVAPNQSVSQFAPTYFSAIRRPDEEQQNYTTPAIGA